MHVNHPSGNVFMLRPESDLCVSYLNVPTQLISLQQWLHEPKPDASLSFTLQLLLIFPIISGPSVEHFFSPGCPMSWK